MTCSEVLPFIKFGRDVSFFDDSHKQLSHPLTFKAEYLHLMYEENESCKFSTESFCKWIFKYLVKKYYPIDFPLSQRDQVFSYIKENIIIDFFQSNQKTISVVLNFSRALWFYAKDTFRFGKHSLPIIKKIKTSEDYITLLLTVKQDAVQIGKYFNYNNKFILVKESGQMIKFF